jgi:hypothetical protein
VEMWDEVPFPGGVSTEGPESRIGIMAIGTGEIGAAA